MPAAPAATDVREAGRATRGPGCGQAASVMIAGTTSPAVGSATGRRCAYWRPVRRFFRPRVPPPG